MVLVIGQFTMAGVTVTEYVVVMIEPVGITGAIWIEILLVLIGPPVTQVAGLH